MEVDGLAVGQYPVSRPVREKAGVRVAGRLRKAARATRSNGIDSDYVSQFRLISAFFFLTPQIPPLTNH